MSKRKILFAVLNWGLGHASRSIPLIRKAEAEGFEPVLASDGEAFLLLRKEFPHLQCYELPSYDITYPKNGRNYKWHFLKKGPTILQAIIREQRQVEQLIEGDLSITGVVSDNRLGAFSRKVPSVYLTHQLKVFSGRTTGLSSLMHRYFINKFKECWVPDVAGEENLSGELSHGTRLKVPVKYLGSLSRLKIGNLPPKYDLLVLLSGPEPQRSLLEELLLKELSGTGKKVLFVCGKMEKAFKSETKAGVEVGNFLTGEALENAVNQSDLILARSGYSTIMDLSVLGKKAFFIPTPGQPEQEYLAKLMQERNIAPYCEQDAFRLEKLEETALYSGFPLSGTVDGLAGLFALFQGK